MISFSEGLFHGGESQSPCQKNCSEPCGSEVLSKESPKNSSEDASCGENSHNDPQDHQKEGVRTVTFGCRLNFAESNVMESLARDKGLKNAIIVNTCAVTKEAERQGRQHIRRLRKENPDAFIIATGCAVQLRPESFTSMGEVDRVVGNALKNHKDSFAPKEEGETLLMAPMRPEGLERPMPVLRRPNQTKAFVQIQNGCNHSCAFCTIPRARGRSRSVPPRLVEEHIRELLDQGVQEIVLTGVDLTSYMYPQNSDFALGCLLEHLLKEIPHLQRLRLSSLDSMEVDQTLFDLIVGEKRILPHIHLSLQSGNDTILTSMRRRHSRQQALELCLDLKSRRPEIALGADFIAGFPGETEDMFQDTFNFVSQGQLSHLHVFPFSPRPKTEAASLEPKVPHDVVKERAQRLRQEGQRALHHWLEKKIGTKILVMAEQERRGHSCDFSQVIFTENVVPGTLVEGQVLSCRDGSALVVDPFVAK